MSYWKTTRITDTLYAFVDGVAKLNGYRAELDVAVALSDQPTRIRIEFKHSDPTQNWSYSASRVGGKSSLEVFKETFLPACKAAGFKMPGDHQQPLNCKVCGCTRVSIRGQHPKDAKRIVCPTCLADTLDDIRQRVSPHYNIPATDAR